MALPRMPVWLSVATAVLTAGSWTAAAPVAAQQSAPMALASHRAVYDLKLSTTQTGNCGGTSYWTMPTTSGSTPQAAAPPKKCSLNDKKWFVLMQLR